MLRAALLDLAQDTETDATERVRRLFTDHLGFKRVDEDVALYAPSLPRQVSILADRYGLRVVYAPFATSQRAFLVDLQRTMIELRWRTGYDLIVVAREGDGTWHIAAGRHVAGLYTSLRLVFGSRIGVEVASRQLAHLASAIDRPSMQTAVARCFDADTLVASFASAVRSASQDLRVMLAGSPDGDSSSERAELVMMATLALRYLETVPALDAAIEEMPARDVDRVPDQADGSNSDAAASRIRRLQREAPDLAAYLDTSISLRGVPGAAFEGIIRDLVEPFDLAVHEALPWSVPVAVRPRDLARGLLDAQAEADGRRLGAYVADSALSFLAQETLRGYLTDSTGIRRDLVQAVFKLRNARGPAEEDFGSLYGLLGADRLRQLGAGLRDLTIVDTTAGSGEFMDAMLRELIEALEIIEAALEGPAAARTVDRRWARMASAIERNLIGLDPDPKVLPVVGFRLWLAGLQLSRANGVVSPVRPRLACADIFDPATAQRVKALTPGGAGLVMVDLTALQRLTGRSVDGELARSQMYEHLLALADQMTQRGGRFIIVQALRYVAAHYGEALQRMQSGGGVEKLVDFGLTKMHYVETRAAPDAIVKASPWTASAVGLLGARLLEGPENAESRTQVLVRRYT